MIVRDVPRVSAFDWHGEHQTSIKPTEDSAGEVSTQIVVTGNDMGPDKIKLPGSRNDAFQTADLAVDPSQRFRPATHSNPDANFDDEAHSARKGLGVDRGLISGMKAPRGIAGELKLDLLKELTVIAKTLPYRHWKTRFRASERLTKP